MIAITFESAPAFLLDTPANFGAAVQLSATIPTALEIGLTQVETRRHRGATLRLELVYSITLGRGALATFRNSLQAWGTEPILCPLWPHSIAPGAAPVVTSDWYALIDDDAAPAIVEAGAWPFARVAYPLMIGRFDRLPEPGLIHDELAEINIAFVENALAALTFPLPTMQPGLAVGAGTPGIWPWRPNWRQALGSGGSSREIERREIGPGRVEQSALYDQAARRKLGLFFTLEGQEWAEFIGLTVARADHYWIPAGLAEARLTADVGASDTALNVDDVTARGENDALILDDGTTRAPVRVTGNVASTWTLAGAVGAEFLAAQTRIEGLVLARYESPVVRLTFLRPELAEATVEFLEVATEWDPPAGETLGTTHGELPPLVHLYHFWIEYPGATQHFRFTGYESPLTYASEVWASQPFAHGDLTQTDDLQSDKAEISTRYFSGNPLGLLIPHALEWPLNVEILEADLISGVPANVATLFRGTIQGVSADGPFLRATAASLARHLAKPLPRWLMQPTCNLHLFEPLCGLDPADWEWTGDFVSYNAATLEMLVENVARTLGTPPTLVEHYFAGGYLFFGAGAAVQYRAVRDSSAESGGDVTLVLGTPLATVPSAGALVTFHPGCDGRYETCLSKFDNGLKFLGFPFMPIGNPSALKVSENLSSGGKK